LISEAMFPIVGWLDDVGVAIVVMAWVMRKASHYS